MKSNGTLFCNPPPEFPAGVPGFVADLKSYSPFVPRRFRKADKAAGEIDFSSSLAVKFIFPDPEGLLVTAVGDLQRFLRDAGLGGGSIPLVIRSCEGMERESFRIAVEDGIKERDVFPAHGGGYTGFGAAYFRSSIS